MKLLDKIFNKEKYLTFFDKDGILKNGVWVLFKNQSRIIYKILPNSEIGDILLAIDIRGTDLPRTMKDMAVCEPEPKYIAGFGITSQQCPQNIPKYISEYLAKIRKYIRNNKNISKYNKQVYKYLIDILSDSTLIIRDDITMKM